MGYKFIKNLLVYIFLPVIIGWLFFASLSPKIEEPFLIVDEVVKIERTIYLEKYWQLDFKNPIWQEWHSYDQPMGSNYVYGLGFFDLAKKAGSYSTFLEENGFNDKKEYCPANPTIGSHGEWFYCYHLKPLNQLPNQFIKPKNVLLRARTVALLFSTLNVITVYYLGLIFGGVWLGISAAVLLALNPLFQGTAIQAMIDPILVFLANTQLLILLLYFKQKKGKIALSLLLGLVSGLGASMKINSAVGLIFADLAILTWFFIKKNKSIIYQLIIINLVSLLVFFALNPYLWQNPIENLKYMYDWRIMMAEGQKKAAPQEAINSFSESLAYLKFDLFNYYDLGRRLWQKAVGLPIFVLGFVSLLLSVIKRKFSWFSINKLILIFYALFMIVSLGAYLPMKWGRYLLPVLPAITLVQASFFVFLLDNISIIISKFNKK